jgi:hypothetical protein
MACWQVHSLIALFAYVTFKGIRRQCSELVWRCHTSSRWLDQAHSLLPTVYKKVSIFIYTGQERMSLFDELCCSEPLKNVARRCSISAILQCHLPCKPAKFIQQLVRPRDPSVLSHIASGCSTLVHIWQVILYDVLSNPTTPEVVYCTTSEGKPVQNLYSNFDGFLAPKGAWHTKFK